MITMNALEIVRQYYDLPFEPRPDQVEDVNELCNYERGGAYLPVGSGKTFVATMIALYFGIQDKIDQVLVLAPPILLKQWAVWLSNFEALSVTVYKGTPAQRKNINLSSDAIIMTSGILKNDYESLMKILSPRRVFIIVDEATVVRNCESLAHKALRDLMNTGDKRLVLLTGTTISAPWQSYGYIKLIVPSVYRDYRQFQMIHVTGVDQYDTPSTYRELDLLARNMKLQTVRREAEDILNLPDITYTPIVYELTPAHQRLYNAVIEELLVELDDGKILDGLIPARMRMTAQRVVLMPTEFSGEKIVPAGLALIDDFLSDLEGAKLIVYSNFHTSNETIYDYCLKLKINPALVYGGSRSTSKKNQLELERFMADPTCRVLVGNPESCGIGVDGLQEICHAALFLELPTPAIFLQAVGRIKRQKQKEKCTVRIAVAAGTVQVDKQRNSMKKEDLCQKVVETKDTLRRALTGR